MPICFDFSSPDGESFDSRPIYALALNARKIIYNCYVFGSLTLPSKITMQSLCYLSNEATTRTKTQTKTKIRETSKENEQRNKSKEPGTYKTRITLYCALRAWICFKRRLCKCNKFKSDCFTDLLIWFTLIRHHSEPERKSEWERDRAKWQR